MSFPTLSQSNIKLTEEQIHEDVAYYQNKIRNIATCSEHEVPLMLKIFIEGIAKIGNMQSTILLSFNQAKKKRKEAEAIAVLEKYPEWCQSKKKKGTVVEGQSFTDLDAEVQSARENEHYYEALNMYLQNARQTLVYAHDDLKKITYTNMSSGNQKMYPS